MEIYFEVIKIDIFREIKKITISKFLVKFSSKKSVVSKAILLKYISLYLKLLHFVDNTFITLNEFNYV